LQVTHVEITNTGPITRKTGSAWSGHSWLASRVARSNKLRRGLSSLLFDTLLKPSSMRNGDTGAGVPIPRPTGRESPDAGLQHGMKKDAAGRWTLAGQRPLPNRQARLEGDEGGGLVR
jgi:hypothetical protein